jgi:hypothetical protein
LSLAVAFVLYLTLIPKTPDGDLQSDRFAKILATWTEDPGITASTYYDSDQTVAVVWLDGLEDVPGSYAQK